MSENIVSKPRPQKPKKQKSDALPIYWRLDRMPTAVQIHHVIPNVLIYVHGCLFIYYLFMILIDAECPVSAPRAGCRPKSHFTDVFNGFELTGMSSYCFPHIIFDLISRRFRHMFQVFVSNCNTVPVK